MSFPTSPSEGDFHVESNINFVYFEGKWSTVIGGSGVPSFDVIGATGPQGTTGPVGPDGATGVFASGQDITAGDISANKLTLGDSTPDISITSGDLRIQDSTTTRYTFARTTGNFTATGNVTAFSDVSIKENIEVIPAALDKVSAIRGVTYDRTDIEAARQAGVIAQEVEEVLPEVVTEVDGIKTVAYGNMVGLLVEAIKELRAEVESLKGGK